MYKKIFGISAHLSNLLQAKSIELGNAVTVIEAVIDSVKIRITVGFVMGREFVIV